MPTTEVVNCCAAPARTLGPAGESEIDCVVGFDREFGEPATPAQLDARMVRTITSVEVRMRSKIAPNVPEPNCDSACLNFVR
jgi:hypothetical protein